MDSLFSSSKTHEGGTLKLHTVSETYYVIQPIAGIDHVVDRLYELFSDDNDVSCLGVSYTVSPDILSKLSGLTDNARVFCGRITKPEMIRGVYVTPAHTHFKGIMMWSECKIAYYIGSSNLTNESGGNYGIFVVKNDTFDFFDVNYPSVFEYSGFGDPFFIIFNEIVFRETQGLCEYTGKRFDRLLLFNKRFKGVD